MARGVLVGCDDFGFVDYGRHLGARLLQWLVQYRHQPLLPVLRRQPPMIPLLSKPRCG